MNDTDDPMNDTDDPKQDDEQRRALFEKIFPDEQMAERIRDVFGDIFADDLLDHTPRSD